MDRSTGPLEAAVTFFVGAIVFYLLFLCLTADVATKQTCAVETSNGLDKTVCIIQHSL